MARREFPKPVKRDAFLRAAGRCEGVGCGAKLTVGKFDYDHIIPDWMGGEPILENCAVLCAPCHKVKTKQDAANRGKVQRQEDRHRGIRSAPQIQSAGLRKRPPQRSATREIPKLAITYQPRLTP